MSDARSGEESQKPVSLDSLELEGLKKAKGPLKEFYSTEKDFSELMKIFYEIISNIEEKQKLLQKANQSNKMTKAKFSKQVKKIPVLITDEEVTILNEFINEYKQKRLPHNPNLPLISPTNMGNLEERLKTFLARNEMLAKKTFSYDSSSETSYDFLGELRLKRFIDEIPLLKTLTGSALTDKLNELFSGFSTPWQLDDADIEKLIPIISKFSKSEIPWEDYSPEERIKLKELISLLLEYKFKAISKEDLETLHQFLRPYQVFAELGNLFADPPANLDDQILHLDTVLHSREFERFWQAIQDVISNSDAFNKFLEYLEKTYPQVLYALSDEMQLFERKKLSAQLIKPAQHLPRFVLKLKEILKSLKDLKAEIATQATEEQSEQPGEQLEQETKEQIEQCDELISIMKNCQASIEQIADLINEAKPYLTLKDAILRELLTFQEMHKQDKPLSEKDAKVLSDVIEKLQKIDPPHESSRFLTVQTKWLGDIREALKPILTKGKSGGLFSESKSPFSRVAKSIDKIINDSEIKKEIDKGLRAEKSLEKAAASINEFVVQREVFRHTADRMFKDLVELKKHVPEHARELSLFLNLIRRLRVNLFDKQMKYQIDNIDHIQDVVTSQEFKSWVESLQDYSIAYARLEKLLKEIRDKSQDPASGLATSLNRLLASIDKPIHELSSYVTSVKDIQKKTPEQLPESSVQREKIVKILNAIEKDEIALNETITPERESLAYRRSLHTYLAQQLGVMLRDIEQEFNENKKHPADSHWCKIMSGRQEKIKEALEKLQDTGNGQAKYEIENMLKILRELSDQESIKVSKNSKRVNSTIPKQSVFGSQSDVYVTAPLKKIQKLERSLQWVKTQHVDRVQVPSQQAKKA